MFRILVVDDNPVNLDLTSRMLRKAGYSVDIAADGEEGVEKAAVWRYDLILMDMAMPGIGGGDATKAIRSAEQAAGIRRVPIIAFTANALEDFRQRAMRSDMDDFITKPIERRQFLTAVERSIDARTVVLLADDVGPDRDRALRYLRAMQNVGVIPAASGAEALAACTRQRISLALINHGLRDADGFEVAHTIHTLYGDSIGIVSVLAPSDARPAATEFVGHLAKPYTQEALGKAVQPLPASV